MQAQTRELSKELYVCTLCSRANRNGSRGCNGRSAGPRLGPLPWVSGEEQSSLQQQQLRYLGGYAVSWPGCSRQP